MKPLEKTIFFGFVLLLAAGLFWSQPAEAACCGNGVCDTSTLSGCPTESVTTCPADCSSVITIVPPKCGDNKWNQPPPTEVCDGTDFGGQTCQAFGFFTGTLSCINNCRVIDTSGCNNCGNGTIQSPEPCDGSNLNGQTCASTGFTSGTLKCTTGCTYDTSGCTKCGNGVVESPPEQCDGINLNSQTCITMGFSSGALTCKTDCTLDATQCSNKSVDPCGQLTSGQKFALINDNNACTQDTCINVNGVATASHTNAANGSSCDDVNLCTQSSSCQSGTCVGSNPVTCPAGDQCNNTGICDATTGKCSALTPKPAGTLCNDNQPCTKTDKCTNGVCGGAPTCPEDSLSCTTVTCNASGTSASCSTSVTSGCLIAGVCYADGAVNPSNACQVCKQSNPSGWTNVDGPLSNDNNACTDNVCKGGVAYPAAAVGTVCHSSAGVCDKQETCDGVSKSCPADAFQSMLFVCHASTGVCDAAEFCTGNSASCPADISQPNGTICSDNNKCTQTDTCQNGSCSGSNLVTCPIGDQCHNTGTCDPTSGACSNPAKTDGTSCNDSNSCSKTDICKTGACTGTSYSCDDGLSCTVDMCDGSGGCFHGIAAGTCKINGACYKAGDLNPANPCQVCDPTKGLNAWQSAADGFTCSDKDACTSGDKCSSGVCTSTPYDPAAHDDGKTCTIASCNPLDGSTVQKPALNGTVCNDGNGCTDKDACSSGTCSGVPVSLTGATDCLNAEICDPATGTKTQTAKADGTFCQDGNPCTVDPKTNGDSCQNGTCVGGPLKPVDDGNPCTADSCDWPGSGNVIHVATVGAVCDDNDACTSNDKCNSLATCKGTNIDTNNNGVADCKDKCLLDPKPADGVCTKAVCTDGTVGWLQVADDTKTCNDGNSCTQTDSCQNGNCVGAKPVVCSAGDQCHDAGTCDPNTGQCSNPNKIDGASCNDSDACTQSDSCSNGACIGSNPVVCTSDQCHNAGTCNAATGTCTDPVNKTNGTACEDGSLCYKGDSCQKGICTGGNDPACSSSDPCQDAVCFAVDGTCSFKTKTYDDEPLPSACEKWECQNGIKTKVPSNLNGGCDDGNKCTTLDSCNAAGSCQGTPMVCNDDNKCTNDSCDAATGCVNNPVGAGQPNACNGCMSMDHQPGENCTKGTGECQGTGTYQCDPPNEFGGSESVSCNAKAKPEGTLITDDGNDCTEDKCDVNGNPSHPNKPDKTTCDDKSECTKPDECKEGKCIGYQNVDDNNPLTVDSCPNGKDPVHTPKIPISDNNPCTNDTLDPNTGETVHTPVVAEDDHNACTTDSCDKATGLAVHTDSPPVDLDDKNACTTDSCDKSTGLAVHTDSPPVDLDDKNACTTDSCDKATGLAVHTDSPPADLDDKNACTTDSCDKSTGLAVHTDSPPADLDDKNACTTDSCDKSTGLAVHTDSPPADLDDKNACTTDSCDKATGLAVHTDSPPADLDDKNACTTDSCDKATGKAIHTSIPTCKQGDQPKAPSDPCDGVVTDDNNPCTNDTCVDGAKVNTEKVFTSENPCMTALCNPSTGEAMYTLGGSKCEGKDDPSLKPGESCELVDKACIITPAPAMNCELVCDGTVLKGDNADCTLTGQNIDLTEKYGENGDWSCQKVPPEGGELIPENNFAKPIDSKGAKFFVEKIDQTSTISCAYMNTKTKQKTSCSTNIQTSECGVSCLQADGSKNFQGTGTASCSFFKPNTLSCEPLSPDLKVNNDKLEFEASGPVENKKVGFQCNLNNKTFECADALSVVAPPAECLPIQIYPTDTAGTYTVSYLVYNTLTGTINGQAVDPSVLGQGYTIDTTMALTPNAQGEVTVEGKFQGAPGTKEAICTGKLTVQGPATCGDGNADKDEECDDGKNNGSDTCTQACKKPICGDGEKNRSDEECDEGSNLNKGLNGELDHCTNACKKPICGDGLKNVAQEECDDGNTISGDGCNSQCLTEATCTLAEASQSDLEANGLTTVKISGVGDEACLATGNCKKLSGGYALFTVNCTPPETEFKPFVSKNGSQDPDKGTKDGLLSLCSPIQLTCKPSVTCGNKQIDAGEDCDAGDENGKPDNLCSQDCKKIAPKELPDEPYEVPATPEKPAAPAAPNEMSSMFFSTDTCAKSMGMANCFSCAAPQQVSDMTNYVGRYANLLQEKKISIMVQQDATGTQFIMKKEDQVADTVSLPSCACPVPQFAAFNDKCATGNPWSLNCMSCLTNEQVKDLSERAEFKDDKGQNPTVACDEKTRMCHIQSSYYNFDLPKCGCDPAAPQVEAKTNKGSDTGGVENTGIMNLACQEGSTRAFITAGPRMGEEITLDAPCKLNEQEFRAALKNKTVREITNHDIEHDHSQANMKSLSELTNKAFGEFLKGDDNIPVMPVSLPRNGAIMGKVWERNQVFTPEVKKTVSQKVMNEKTGEIEMEADGTIKLQKPVKETPQERPLPIPEKPSDTPVTATPVAATPLTPANDQPKSPEDVTEQKPSEPANPTAPVEKMDDTKPEEPKPGDIVETKKPVEPEKHIQEKPVESKEETPNKCATNVFNCSVPCTAGGTSKCYTVGYVGEEKPAAPEQKPAAGTDQTGPAPNSPEPGTQPEAIPTKPEAPSQQEPKEKNADKGKIVTKKGEKLKALSLSNTVVEATKTSSTSSTATNETLAEVLQQTSDAASAQTLALGMPADAIVVVGPKVGTEGGGGCSLMPTEGSSTTSAHDFWQHQIGVLYGFITKIKFWFATSPS